MSAIIMTARRSLFTEHFGPSPGVRYHRHAAAVSLGSRPVEGWVPKEAVMATSPGARVLRRPGRARRTGGGRRVPRRLHRPHPRSYTTDLRIFAEWCHDHGINLLERQAATSRDCSPGGWKQEGRMRRRRPAAVDVGAASTATATTEGSSTRTRRPTSVVPRSTTSRAPSGLDRNELGALLVQAGLGTPAIAR